jgi:hypothetical protein
MDPELRDILERPEGHRLDFKRTDALDHNRKLAQHLVAFANRYGGKLVFGVTDDGELEGSDIDEESALRSLRSISRIRCNPPVNFEEKLYQEVSYEGRTGDILVVDISPKQASPHAVVPGGNNEERSFYIRTADESRLIKDSEELRHLFVNDPDPSFKEVLPTAIVHKLYTYEPIRMRRSLPGWLDYRLFLNRLTDDDRSFLKSQDTGKDSETLELQPVEDAKEDAGSIMVREVFPAILFDSFRRQTPDFWIDRVVSNDDEYEVYMQHTEHLSFDDLVKSSNQSILPQLSLNLDRVFHTNAPLLRVPLGTEAVIRAHNQSECPSCLTLKIENKFRVDIELSLDRGTRLC